MFKVAAYMAAFYIVYSFLLSRDTTYVRNRAFILFSLAASLFFPIITFQTIKPLDIQFFGKFLTEVFVTSDNTTAKDASKAVPELIQILRLIYVSGLILTLLKLVFNFTNLCFLILRQKKRGSRIIRFHGFNTAGFSALGHIFINTRLSPEEAGSIIKHEKNHLQHNHFIDIVFVEIVKAFQWFNPFIYLFNRALRAVHEFQADQSCLNSGIPVISYQSLLLSQIFKSKAFNLTNSFSNPSLIKRRMLMMTKKRTSTIANIKLLLVIPAFSLVFLTISAYKEPAIKIQLENAQVSNEEPEIPFVVVEEMPMFPGGDAALLKFLSDNTRYPDAAKKEPVKKGKVIVRFCVTAKGGVSQASVLKGVSPELDAEALRVVKTLPEFKPGKQGGKPVPVWYMVPITFTLK